MLQKSRGIILHYLKYGETSIIAHIYTEKAGRRSFMLKAIRSKRSKYRANMIQPLFLVDLEYYDRPHRELCIVKEISLSRMFISIPYDVKKSAQAMFISEVLHHTLKEEEQNPVLFHFLASSIEYFDLLETGNANFHLVFLLKLTRFLGILPNAPQSGENFFNIKEGSFESNNPTHFHFMEATSAQLLGKLMGLNYDDSSSLRISSSERNKLLEELMRFYNFHHIRLDHLKSLEILKEVFH